MGGKRADDFAFQSTLPARGATDALTCQNWAIPISIHAPRTGSDSRTIKKSCKNILISIHAPRMGSDYVDEKTGQLATISIHAPRTGSDNASAHFHRGGWNFNPRSPHGERHPRDATHLHQHHISIHAPRTGSDPSSPLRQRRSTNFNPRSPHGERPLLTTSLTTWT